MFSVLSKQIFKQHNKMMPVAMPMAAQQMRRNFAVEMSIGSESKQLILANKFFLMFSLMCRN